MLEFALVDEQFFEKLRLVLLDLVQHCGLVEVSVTVLVLESANLRCYHSFQGQVTQRP